MKTLIINGSPKKESGNTEVFIRQFIQGMKSPCEVCYASKGNYKQIAEYLQGFDTVIFAMPLYIHAMPSIVMKIFEYMEPTLDHGKSMGFIVQSGFIESAQSIHLERYLTALAKRLNYTYLGTVIKGGSAGVSMMPENMNKKLFFNLHRLGEHFEVSSSFDSEVIEELSKPYELSKSKIRLYQFLSKLGLESNLFFNMMLKKNKALNRKFDKPFTVKPSD